MRGCADQDDFKPMGWRLMGRHRRGHGFRHFAGAFMGGPGGFGGFDFRAGRKLAAGDLQIVLLALLADGPRHGYELMKALEQRSGGFYSPSPGMIYPALTLLEELEYASVEVAGTKKLYNITPAGLDYLAKNRAAAEAMLNQLELIGKKMEWVRSAFAGEDPSTDEERGSEPGAREIWLARRELKSALKEKRGASTEEAQHIAAILRRAAADIRG
jgi:DNA-binding PadR family transcriptional regulator